MSTVITKFSCPKCGCIYDTAEAAEACGTMPLFPEGTKYAVYRGWSYRYLSNVLDIEGKGCRQLVCVKPHPLFKRDMHSVMKGGAAYPLERKQTPYPGNIQPITPEFAREALADLERTLKDRERYVDELKKRKALLLEYLQEAEA